MSGKGTDMTGAGDAIKRSDAQNYGELKYKAAIFDLDGTLVDSYKAWEYSYRKALAAVGHDMTDAEFVELYHMTVDECYVFYKEIFERRTVESSFEDFARGIMVDIRDEMQRLYASEIPEKPYALEYVKSLYEKGAKICVATLTPTALTGLALERLGFMPYIQFIITSDDVGLSKKHPDIYLEAARRLGCAPCDAVVFEDCPTAIATARKAGFMVCGVAEKYRERDITEYAENFDWYIRDYKGAQLSP